jgi:hypothetical protein
MNFAKKVLDDTYPICVLPGFDLSNFRFEIRIPGFTNPDGKDQWCSITTFFGLPAWERLGPNIWVGIADDYLLYICK